MIEASVIIRNRFRSVDSPLERPRDQSAWMRLDVVAGTMIFVPELCGEDRVSEVACIYLAHRLCGIFTRHHLQNDLACSQPCWYFKWRLGR